ncbi:transcriptional regulator protein [Dactylosporangium sp. NPDC050688]|uniref:ParB/RepB/Spo0J family partition protein n=1 Tax=Dactylosporangium sp. NPDC050688 TaxID=3157217 RepID=UPI0033CA1F35
MSDTMVDDLLRSEGKVERDHGGMRVMSRTVHEVPVSSLVGGRTPRLAGIDPDHVEVLAETDAALPPILVHAPTNSVIDGMHRLHAAIRRGDELILVEYFHGDEADAFVEAVRANIAHGMPLNRADRQAAATRIISTHPQLSDRALAQIAGISAGTVAKIRAQASPDGDCRIARIGKDGRKRRLDVAEARRRAVEVLIDRPEASLREVARATGLSPETVRDVRARMARGEPSVPAPRQPEVGRPVERLTMVKGGQQRAAKGTTVAMSAAERGADALLKNLYRDPSLRFNEPGRQALQWLSLRAGGIERWERLCDVLPLHSRYLVAELARNCARQWTDFAESLEQQLRRSS